MEKIASQFFGLICFLLIPLLLCICCVGSSSMYMLQAQAPDSGSAPGNATTWGGKIAQTALDMAKGITGDPDQNYHDAALTDKNWQQAINYWLTECGGCIESQSGFLQCIMFVIGVFGVLNIPLAYKGGDAWTLWYQDLPGYDKYAPGSGTCPEPGDMIVYSGGAGHIQIVTAVHRVLGNLGTVTVAQANAWKAIDDMVLLPNCDVIPYPGLSLEGYIRKHDSHQLLNGSSAIPSGIVPPCNILDTNTHYVAELVSDAEHYGFDGFGYPSAQYLVNQVCKESNFDPYNPDGSPLKSSAGALGIGQFTAAAAQEIPLCSNDFKAAKCDANSQPQGIDPTNPDVSLAATAWRMDNYYQFYLGKDTAPTQAAINDAFTKALAAYNYGKGGTDSLIGTYGPLWENYLPAETFQYIQYVMGNANS